MAADKENLQSSMRSDAGVEPDGKAPQALRSGFLVDPASGRLIDF